MVSENHHGLCNGQISTGGTVKLLSAFFFIIFFNVDENLLSPVYVQCVGKFVCVHYVVDRLFCLPALALARFLDALMPSFWRFDGPRRADGRLMAL